jgi:dTDP-4-dehydrorhamnose 3,5-epimerase
MIRTNIPEVKDCYIIRFDRHVDNRGYFQEVFSRKNYQMDVLQTNVSYSDKNVLRGLHVAPFAKLCTCIRGRLFDVVADVRKDSPTFGKWFGIWLAETEFYQLYVPAGCAHGFFSAEDNTILLYQQDGIRGNIALDEYEIHFQDPLFGINWPEAEYILSEKDKKAKNFSEVTNENTNQT